MRRLSEKKSSRSPYHPVNVNDLPVSVIPPLLVKRPTLPISATF